MGIEEREKAWQKGLEDARAQGLDFVTRSYPEFDAKFLACVVEGCDWVDYMPLKKDTSTLGPALMAHITKYHPRDGKKK